MREVEITIGRLLRVYWLFLWRAIIGGLVIGAVFGFVIGFIMGAAGFAQAQIAVVTSTAGLIIGTVWSVVVVRMMLEKQYSDFRIALIER
jgi:membrane associated rhomboid family serine protease